jgi:hypothetical protein
MLGISQERFPPSFGGDGVGNFGEARDHSYHGDKRTFPNCEDSH